MKTECFKELANHEIATLAVFLLGGEPIEELDKDLINKRPLG